LWYKKIYINYFKTEMTNPAETSVQPQEVTPAVQEASGEPQETTPDTNTETEQDPINYKVIIEKI
jgi:hypothetical protein